jgi:hypothetical protein
VDNQKQLLSHLIIYAQYQPILLTVSSKNFHLIVSSTILKQSTTIGNHNSPLAHFNKEISVSIQAFRNWLEVKINQAAILPLTRYLSRS